jgi:hypothetical protein
VIMVGPALSPARTLARAVPYYTGRTRRLVMPKYGVEFDGAATKDAKYNPVDGTTIVIQEASGEGWMKRRRMSPDSKS